MKTLRLHNNIYPAAAIEETVKVFNDYASMESSQDGPYTEIRIEPIEGVDAAELVGGFSNYVLTLAVQSASTGPPAPVS